VSVEPASEPAVDRRSTLLEQVLLEARRGGSLGTLHNRAAADLVGMNQTDWDCLDVLDWTGPPADERQAGLQESFGQLATEMFAVSEEFDADQLEAILRWLKAGNDAVERSTARMRDRA
jgi:hypothetical protein